MLTYPLVLCKPDTIIPLLVCITTIEHIVSATLVQENEAKQELMYFVNRTLQEQETW